MPKYPKLPLSPELRAEADAAEFDRNTQGDPWAHLDEFAPEEVALRQTPEAIEERRVSGRRKASLVVDNERRLSDRRQQQIMADEFEGRGPNLGSDPVPDFTAWEDENTWHQDQADDLEPVHGRLAQEQARTNNKLAELARERGMTVDQFMEQQPYEPQRTVGHTSYWDDMSEFMEPGQSAPEPAGGSEAAKSYGYTQRWSQRGQAAKQALGRLGKRAMAIPGVEPASVIGRTAGRYLGPFLGAAGPVFDAMAINELHNQYGEAKAGLAHKTATEMHTANKYPTQLAAKQTRKEFDRLRAIADREATMVQQAAGQSSIQVGPGGESIYQLPDGTIASSDNLRAMKARGQRGY